jgi:rubrerythrin
LNAVSELRRPTGVIDATRNEEFTMTISHEEMLDIFCQVLDMKQKKKDLYQAAMTSCEDQVGKETFRYLRDSESSHLKELQDIYDELKKGASWADACRFVETSAEDVQQLFTRIAEEHNKAVQRCDDDLSALQTGIQLEEASIKFFEEKLNKASEPTQKELLKRMASDERQHRTALADLQFYYSDPQAWFMEKSGARLDGAGPMA